MSNNNNESISGVTETRDLWAKYMMVALGVATIGAFINSVSEIRSFPEDSFVIYTWQMLAFPVFAGLFTLLGLYPRRMPGIWELVLFQKVGVTLFNLFMAGRVTGRVTSDNPYVNIIVDGLLVVITLASYVLTKGWRAWRAPHST
ncbi:hypothetical protein LPTSP3_g08910 [Leptospira kobayashii]|uniref:Uncharacterized protein n=1 Tax=Leptospira kobayashii TaxID=1917830 RepID=A0ABM7UH30_9LEPT|nr:hypothetical protein [Leptospira kobayashii]BDA77961.1 hypothetical protein LPTSP3_g08910 [Leptospira kobayashii]